MDAQDFWEVLMKYDREIMAPRFEEMLKRFDARCDSMATRDELRAAQAEQPNR